MGWGDDEYWERRRSGPGVSPPAPTEDELLALLREISAGQGAFVSGASREDRERRVRALCALVEQKLAWSWPGKPTVVTQKGAEWLRENEDVKL